MSAFMKRNGCLVFCFCLSIVLLTGCSSADLSEENQDKVAEYASEVVLKHDANYDKKRIDTEAAATSSPEVSQSPEATPEPTAAPETAVTEGGQQPEKTAIPEVSLEELYQLKDVSISYQSYEICSKYPKKSEFSMIAKKGETFFIVKFMAENKSSSKTKVDLIKRKIDYELMVGEKPYNPTIAMLMNGGLNNFKTTLNPKEKQKAVLVYNVPNAEINAETLTLTIKEGDKKAHTIVLKASSNE